MTGNIRNRIVVGSLRKVCPNVQDQQNEMLDQHDAFSSRLNTGFLTTSNVFQHKTFLTLLAVVHSPCRRFFHNVKSGKLCLQRCALVTNKNVGLFSEAFAKSNVRMSDVQCLPSHELNGV